MSAYNLVLLGLCLICLQKNLVGKVLVYRHNTSQLIEEFDDLPATYGPCSNDVRVFVVPHEADNPYGCGHIRPPPHTGYPTDAKFAAIISRGGDCSFEQKTLEAQNANYDAVIIYNNEGEKLELMSADISTGIHIPSVFVGLKTGKTLLMYNTFEKVLVINEELPFNYYKQLILPYSILIALTLSSCLCLCLLRIIYKKCRCKRKTTDVEQEDILLEALLIDMSNDDLEENEQMKGKTGCEGTVKRQNRNVHYVPIKRSSEDESYAESECAYNRNNVSEELDLKNKNLMQSAISYQKFTISLENETSKKKVIKF